MMDAGEKRGLTRRAMLGTGGALAGLTLLPFPVRAFSAASQSRIASLIAQMTVAEKAGQLSIFPAALKSAAATAVNPISVTGSTEEQAEKVRQGHLGAVFNGNALEWHRSMQQVAVNESRLKIPLLFAADVIHGYRTIFPIPLAEVAAFDPDLCERTARAAAVEATAEGLAWTFAPMVDIARDARWGRSTEGAGEDVLMGNRIAEARTRGFQGRKGLTHPQSMAATAKHFAAYGGAEAGLDYNTVDVSERTLREVYFPPYKASLDAGAPTVMASFNEISGIPAHANPWILQDILRRDWGFEGLVVSDFTGDLELIDHGFAKDEREAAKLSILAGVDMSMASGLYRKYLPELVEAGEVPMARMDEAVGRVLRLKEQLGLFDDPFNRLPAKAKPVTGPGHRPLAREAGQRAIVMLKNDDGLLPLPRANKKIALIGPSVSSQRDQHGSWVIFGKAEENIPLDSAIRGALSNPADLTVVRGSDIAAPLPGGIDEAVAAAQAADLVILSIGESERMAGESKSRMNIVVPEAQQALAEAVAAAGKPVVILLKSGRALALHGAVKAAPAILLTWFLGTEESNAITDILFGKVAPSGRLPVSFPHESGQSPFHYDHKPTGRPVRMDNPNGEYKARFLEATNTAAFPFGHGLTYGDIAYAKTEAGSGKMGWDGSLTISTTITNRGKRDAVEVAQLYIHDRTASITRPVRQLKDFKRVALKPGEAKRVEFTLSRKDLLFVGVKLDWTVEPGLFDVWIAPSAEAGEAAQFELLAG